MRFGWVAGLALLASGGAQAAWQQATSKHFVVYATYAPAQMREFAQMLERYDKAIRTWHLAPEDRRGPSARVTVFVVDDVDAIQRLSGRSGVAGFYQPRAGSSVAFVPRGAGSSADGGLSSRAILFHEYAHHWMLTNWSDAALPPWFVEGFAELHATAIYRDGGFIFGAPPTYRRYTVGQMNLLPATRLLRPDPGKLDPITRDALYSRGWLLTHYLSFDPERRQQLAAYIGALNSGKATDAAAMIGDTSKLDIRLNNYARRPKFASAAFTADQLPAGEIKVRVLGPGEAAMMPAYLLSNRGVDKAAAPKVAALARRLASPYPTDSAVQNALAEAEFDACSTDETSEAACFARADAAANRALAADPGSVHALLYKGLIAEYIARRAKATDAKTWAGVRRWYLAANKADTEMPQPLIAYYDSFVAAGQAPTANAQSALLYAYALAPYDADLRVKATGVYLRQGKPAEARIAVAPIAYDVDDPKRAERMTKVLTAINAGDTAAALKELDRPSEPEES